jgi:GH15 family glucan-1,4-alpha-glucosidase
MLYNRLPQAWSGASYFIKTVRNRNNDQGRIVEVV